MRRREILKAAALACAPLVLRPGRSFGAGADGGRRRRVRPGDAEWPDRASWQRLNDAVGGQLIEVPPLLAPCGSDASGAGCEEVRQQLRNPFYLGDQAAGTQVSGWLDAWTPARSAYAIRARSTADVVAGVNFAGRHHLRLVVKGTGHSYLGTSTAADSLLIWTRGMNRVEMHEAFVPTGCAGSVAAVPAVTAEAGAVSIDLYDAVTTRGGRYVQGGGCTDTGVAGLVQSGGFGSFSKGFGTAASGLVEAEVVLADGTVVTVNACRNPDLFWALKGGGGGTFGVITRVTLRTHTLPAFFGGANATFKARSEAGFERLVARFVAFYRSSLFNPHWGEQVVVGPDNTLDISMCSQGLKRAEVDRVWRPFFDWASREPGLEPAKAPSTWAQPARRYWDVDDNPGLVRDTRDGAAPHRGWWRGDQAQVGAFLHGYDSLWLPASLLDEGGQPRLVKALVAASRDKPVRLHMNKGLAGATPAARAAVGQTATHPAVLAAFALAIIADGERPAFAGLPRPALDLDAARRDARAIDRATAALRALVPDAASYVSESNYFNASWQRAYWGENYARLRAIKTACDPEGLFFVHHGVGSESWSADGFTPV